MRFGFRDDRDSRVKLKALARAIQALHHQQVFIVAGDSVDLARIKQHEKHIYKQSAENGKQ